MRMIDADAAIDAVLELNVEHRVSWVDAVIDMLDEMPTAHPKKGKWIRIVKQHKDDGQEYSYYEIHCSECGAIRKIGWHDARFCPNCGAEMREVTA